MKLDSSSFLAPYNLGRLNPLGLNLAAPALFAYQRDLCHSEPK